MKKLYELMTLCPGRVDIEINKHLVFGETANDVIRREEKAFADTDSACTTKMIVNNAIIRIEALTITKPMPSVIVYRDNIESAIAECLKQIKKWKPERK